MNLARHAAVIWRFRHVAAAGLALGILVALLTSYQFAWKGGPSFTARGSEVWTAISSILVTQPGFPEGRVTLPTRQIDTAVTADGVPAAAKNAPPQDQVEFADPARLANLADLYSKFLTSADVLDRIRGRPKPAQIQASPFAASSNGQVLPIIQLTANSGSERAAERLNVAIYKALRSVLKERQSANKIVVGKRVEVKLIDPPNVTLSSGRSRTMAILGLLLCLIGTLAVVHILEAVRGENTSDGLPGTPVSSPPPYDVSQSERLSLHL
jgi:hypothetical protein